jgi:uncharacterized protein YbjQ (UPF0145 family)
MMLTPSAGIPGYRMVASHGLVRGNTIRARHVGRDITAALRNLVGGEIREYTKMMAEAREQAIDRMIAEAETMGANAIVSVRFATSYIMGSASEILAYGDAVLIEKEPEVGGF